MKKKTEQAAPPKKLKVALLDAEGIYQGVEEINEAQVTSEHVLLPNGCDLPAGEYRWDVQKRTFISLRKKIINETQLDEATLRSLAVGMISLHEQGISLPAETLSWLDSQTSGLTFMAPLSAGTLQMVKAFKARGNK